MHEFQTLQKRTDQFRRNESSNSNAIVAKRILSLLCPFIIQHYQNTVNAHSLPKLYDKI